MLEGLYLELQGANGLGKLAYGDKREQQPNKCNKHVSSCMHMHVSKRVVQLSELLLHCTQKCRTSSIKTRLCCCRLS